MRIKWFGWRVTEDEYRANINGMNTFFGAVLGFVLADINMPRMVDFAQLLMISAAIVIGILYVSASASRWSYAGLNLVMIWALPRLIPASAGDPGRLQVTLAVWTAMTIFLEVVWTLSDRSPKAGKPPIAP